MNLLRKALDRVLDEQGLAFSRRDRGEGQFGAVAPRICDECGLTWDRPYGRHGSYDSEQGYYEFCRDCDARVRDNDEPNLQFKSRRKATNHIRRAA